MTGRLRALGKDAAIALRRAAPVTRRLPSFVVLGAQKAGTSSLFAQLVEHPRVLGGVRKEIHYFDRRARSVSWYRACFPTEAHHRAVQRRVGAPTITGEATPFYLLHPAAPERLAAVIPDARLIVVVRDPVQRAVSGYHHAARFGDEHRPIEDALHPDAEDPLVDAAAWFDREDCPARLRGYLARGRYAEQLERWYRRFPPEQLLVLESTDLASGGGAERALGFLGLDGPVPAGVADRNVGRYGAPPAVVVDRLAAYFRPHNERLFELVGRSWRWT